ncbi:hypothetical protein CXF68_01875 [Tenacibaculum sp. Bg11-29]|uniref:hypothetical protein n=1 Tax=Tenacibaculum sp. Bg11-29 TaxID=2058306 RepID=UPI000C33E1D4|nr:hypothetical protein [Tenacibaculum sp. Bg11-29]PKH49511.1 hypothetical protein CXF68_01875 [Tenacibaculum sp. Bg11-29]
MKKIVLLIIIFLAFIINIQAQFEYKPDTTNLHCISQFEKAKEDFSNKTFVLKFQKSYDYTKTHKKIIENYGIQIEASRIYINNCYDYKIIELLNEKHGFNFIEHTKNEAKELDKNSSESNLAVSNTKEKDSISDPIGYIKKESIGGKLDYGKILIGYGAHNAQYKAYLYSIWIWTSHVKELGITRRKKIIKLWEEIHERKMTTDEKNVIKYGIKIKK